MAGQVRVAERSAEVELIGRWQITAPAVATDHWHEWAEKKARHFEQVKCGECDLYAIWRRKREATDD